MLSLTSEDGMLFVSDRYWKVTLKSRKLFYKVVNGSCHKQIQTLGTVVTLTNVFMKRSHCHATGPQVLGQFQFYKGISQPSYGKMMKVLLKGYYKKTGGKAWRKANGRCTLLRKEV